MAVVQPWEPKRPLQPTSWYLVDVIVVLQWATTPQQVEPELPLVEQLSDQQAPAPYGWLERCELRRRLWKGLKTLSARQRRLVLARVLQQRSWQELGARAGLSARAAQRHYQQACAQVRQQLA